MNLGQAVAGNQKGQQLEVRVRAGLASEQLAAFSLKFPGVVGLDLDLDLGEGAKGM